MLGVYLAARDYVVDTWFVPFVFWKMYLCWFLCLKYNWSLAHYILWACYRSRFSIVALPIREFRSPKTLFRSLVIDLVCSVDHQKSVLFLSLILLCLRRIHLSGIFYHLGVLRICALCFGRKFQSLNPPGSSADTGRFLK